MSKHYKACFGSLLLVYVLSFGWLLVASDYVPYVMDGNESYSSLLHAQNLHRFDIHRSFGLTDESASPDASAHPFVHTHQGNFPRIYAYLIYLAGATTIESQIAVTTFTIGLASVYFAFLFFARVTNPVFALTALLVLISDYVLFAQWQVVTYRVWHAFFVFSSLLCVQGLGSSRRTLWLTLAFLNHLCLFYFEFIFVAFVAMMTALYTAWTYRTNWRLILSGWTVQLAGAVGALGILALQLIAYLGWSDFLQDIKFTFIGRSYATSDPTWMNKLLEFYNTHDIAFFYNLSSAEAYAGIETFLRLLFTYAFGVHSPALTLIVLLIFAGWLGSLVANRRDLPERLGGAGRAVRYLIVLLIFAGWLGSLVANRRDLPERLSGTGRAVRYWNLVAFLSLAAGFFIFFVIIADHAALDGRASGLSALISPKLLFAVFIATFLSFYSARLTARMAERATKGDVSRYSMKLLVAAFYVLMSSVFIALQGRLYSQDLQPIWSDVPVINNYPLLALSVVAAVAIGISMILLGPRCIGRSQSSQLTSILPFLVTGFVAYATAYRLSPGYVHSGYLSRYAPLVVFHIDTVIAAALYILISFCIASSRWLITLCHLPSGANIWAWARRPLISATGALGLMTFFVVSWLMLQVRYISLLPPSQFSFMKMLRAPPFRGASFVVNTYAIPMHTYTGQWAYFDEDFGQAKISESIAGHDIVRNLRYLWFADRHERDDYLRPDYFLCFRNSDMGTAVALLAKPGAIDSGCGSVPLVRMALASEPGPIRSYVIARDGSRLDSWAIVALDWGSLGNSGPTPHAQQHFVNLNVTETAAGRSAVVSYPYGLPENLQPQDMAVQLLQISSSGDGSTTVASRQSSLAEGQGTHRFELPYNYRGVLQATVRTPNNHVYYSPMISSDPAGAALHP